MNFKELRDNFNFVSNVLIISILLLAGFVYADTNGIWHNAEDVRAGTFGTDEDGGTLYAFLNDLSIGGRLSIGGDPQSGNEVGDRDYNDGRYVNVGESDSITGGMIVDSSVTGGDIAHAQITSGHIIDGTIGTIDLGPRIVTSAKLAVDSVTTTELAANAVTSGHIVDGNIGTIDLGSRIVTSAKLAVDSVTTTELAANAVTSGHIVDGNIGIVDVDPNQIQRRVSGSCPGGYSIRQINSDGSVICEPDDVGASAASISCNWPGEMPTSFICYNGQTYQYRIACSGGVLTSITVHGGFGGC